MTRVSVKEAYSNRDLIAQIARLKTYVEQGTFKEVSSSYSDGVLVLTFTAFDDTTQSFNIPMDSIVGITGDQVGNTVTLHVEFASGTVVDIPYTIANADTSPTPDTLGLRDGNGYLKAASPAVGVYDTNLANGTKVKDELDNYAPMVRTVNNQTIAGSKTFSNQIVVSSAGTPSRLLSVATDVLTTPPATVMRTWLAFNAENTLDASAKAWINVTVYTDGRSRITLNCRNADGTAKSTVLLEGNP